MLPVVEVVVVVTKEELPPVSDSSIGEVSSSVVAAGSALSGIVAELEPPSVGGAVAGMVTFQELSGSD